MALATDDIDEGDTKFWSDQSKSVPHPLGFGMSADGSSITGLSVRRMTASTALTKAGHVDDGTTKFSHYHSWDPSGTGSDTFSTANEALANNFWDAVFGVSTLSGNGKLDGDTVTRTKTADMHQDCSSYALSTVGVTGSWKYAIADEAAWSGVTDKIDKANVKANDIIYYKSGKIGGIFGLHMTLIESVDSGNPKNLVWKYGPSGVYKLVRTKDYFATPAYINETAWSGKSWKLVSGGAGDPNNVKAYLRKK